VSIKYQRQIEHILKKWAVPASATAEDIAKQNRWPAGTPASKGGQFAPAKGGGGGGGKKPSGLWWKDEPGNGASQYSSYGSMYGAGSSFPGGESPKWAGEQNAKPQAPPPGAKPHLMPNDKGEPVTINYPTKPSDKAAWTDPKRTATFVPGGDAPDTLNGVAMKPWASVPKSDSEWANVAGQKLSLDARVPFEPTQGKSQGAGVIIREPDGRIWLTRPTNSFGGYVNTFPKGTVEHGLTMQASAIKETWEETGLQIKIVGILGDYERTTSKARFYIAERVGGTPKDMGWESQAVRLSPRADLDKMLNMGVDKGILADLADEGFFEKQAVPAAKPKGNYNANQPRWPSGTPLGGQWKTMDADGITLPPTLAGGLTGSNAAYQKKANAAYDAAKAGNKTTVLDTAIQLQKKVQENEAKGGSSSHVKWTAQLSQFMTQLASDIFASPKAQAIAERLSSMLGLSAMKLVGGKPGGSNPGGMYEDGKGQKWLVKGNAQYTNGAVTATQSADRAKNEVLAARLMQAVGVGAPDMKLVDMEGKHGGEKTGPGSIGVASKWVGGATAFNVNNPAHIAAAREDFAVHAWLGNYDVMGMGYDNTVILNGKAVNIDPGGAILFRAQGLPKDSFGKDASEWETMRKTTSEQKQVYGGMTKSDLAASAAKLAGITDDVIKELVKTHGPGDEKANGALADTLIARRDAILAKAGVAKADTLTGKPDAPAVAAPAPVSTPPSVKNANTPAAPVGGLTKPAYDDTFKKADYYSKLSDQMMAAHAEGDMAKLKALGFKKDGTSKVWPEKGGEPSTVNGKLMKPFHDALMADLEATKGVAGQALAAGKATLTGTDGKTWVDDGKGVLQPTATPNGGLSQAKTADIYNAAFGVANMPPKNDVTNAITAMTAAQVGNLTLLESLQMKSVKGKAFQAGLLGALKVDAAQTAKTDAAVAAVKPVSGAALSLGEVKEAWAAAKIPASLSVDVFLNSNQSTTGKQLIQAALAGDAGKLNAVETETEGMASAKAKLLGAMNTKLGGAQVAPAKPVSTDQIKAITSKHGFDAFLESDIDAVTAAGAAALTGDAKTVGNWNPESAAGKAVKVDLIVAMTGSAPPPQTRPEKPVLATPQPVPQPAPKMPTAAPPNFTALMLPTSNSNAPSHNIKVEKLKALFEAGDENGILSLNFGTNTYGKKQAGLANDALAALGSVHQVQAGQKVNAHPALTGGATQATAANAAGKATPAATPKAEKVATPIYQIPNAPDFANWNGAGQGLSSFAPFNAQNTELAKQIKALGDKLDVEGLKGLKYQPIDQTGAPTGDLKLVSSHKSQHIPKYLADVIDATQNPYVPQKLMTRDELKAIPDAVKDIVSKVADVATFAAASLKIGRYAALGKAENAKAVFDGFPPKQITVKGKTLNVQTLYDESQVKYKKLSSIEKQAISDYTGGSYKSMNSYGSGSLSAKGDIAAQGLRKASVTLPTGTVISRKFNFADNHAQNVKELTAQIGGVIKDFGIISTSTNPQTWSGDVHLHITTAPGVKGLYVAPNPKTGGNAISQNPGENEIILPFGTKFYVKSVTKGSKTDAAGSWGQSAGSSYVVELVALPDLATDE
jgi:ADP-ribose pyrophosphatase YjhB (NUDIX family)